MDYLELPRTGITYFLENLERKGNEDWDILFKELYSWYLRSPQYREMVQRLVDASFYKKAGGPYFKNSGKGPLW